MPVIPFGDWIPDATDLGNPGSLRAENVVPGVNSFKPMKTLVTLTNALDARPRGAIEAIDNDNAVHQYAGNETKIYSLSGTTWSDVSLGGGYSTGAEERWEFVKWQNKVLGVNWNDNPQSITLGGANFTDLTTALKARHITIVRDFVVMANTWDATDGNVPHRVRWSAINDETDWTVSATTLSGFADLHTGGNIQAIVGGEFGVIFSDKSAFRMTFVGSPTVFQIDEVLPGFGTLAPGGVAQLGETVFVLSERGFIAVTNGTSMTPIGAGKIDQWFLNDLDADYLYRISSVVDPASGRVMWAYPGSGNTAGQPNKIMIYDSIFDKWSLLEYETGIELVWRARGIGYTMEGLDALSGSLDALTGSMDGSQWQGSIPQAAAFDHTFAHGFFSGINMPVVIETKEVEMNAGSRTMLNSFRPLWDGEPFSLFGQVGTRNSLTDDVTWSGLLERTSTGRYTIRSNARYHRFRFTVTDAGNSWDDAIGVQVEPRDGRRIGFRG